MKLADAIATAPRSRKRATHAEDAFQASLVSYLRTVLHTKLYVVLAVPNGGLRNKIEAARMKRTGTLAGVPDLCILGPGGSTWWIECKAGAGRLSAKQDQFRRWAIATGVPHLVARSIDDVRPKLMIWGLISREVA